jgi:hypothetical protein
MRYMIQPEPDKLPNWRVPRLHEGLAPEASDLGEILEWCEENCCAPFYTYPEWTGRKGAQFEDDEDANSFLVWSRLRWG